MKPLYEMVEHLLANASKNRGLNTDTGVKCYSTGLDLATSERLSEWVGALTRDESHLRGYPARRPITGMQWCHRSTKSLGAEGETARNRGQEGPSS